MYKIYFYYQCPCSGSKHKKIANDTNPNRNPNIFKLLFWSLANSWDTISVMAIYKNVPAVRDVMMAWAMIGAPPCIINPMIHPIIPDTL